jgi:3-oxoacyl-[acyl-carrier-protein] synthase-3
MVPSVQSTLRPFAILGTGHALPPSVVWSADLDAGLGLPAGAVEGAGGVRKRHFVDNHQTAAALGAEAAREAIKAGNLSFEDIDCLVAASGTMDQALPCNAALIHRELALAPLSIPAFDVNATCLGFIAAVDMLSWPLASGYYRRALIVASDIASLGLNWNDLESSAIFGDGAAAAVVGSCGEHPGSRILASDMITLSAGAALCEIPGFGSRHHPGRSTPSGRGNLTTFRMDGKGVFRLVLSHLPQFVERLFASAGLSREDIDWIVPHQASLPALSHLTKRLGFRNERVVNIFADYGNQVAASLPTALDVAIRDGRIQRGHRVLLLGTGAGVSIGGLILEY